MLPSGFSSPPWVRGMAQSVVDILGLSCTSAWQRENVVELCLDLIPQLPWIGLPAERGELCEAF